jgi:hypothetical protein
VGLIFDDQAFLAPSLTSSERLSELDIEPGRNQLPLDFKSKFDNVPIFRKVIKTLQGFAISLKEPLTYSVVYSAMRKLGQLTGFKQITRPYALRYGAGKAFNENGMYPYSRKPILMKLCIKVKLAKPYKIL